MKTEKQIGYEAVKDFIEHVNTFPDKKLAIELIECIAEDPGNSQPSAQIKGLIGILYEELLQEKLNEKKIIFQTENDLRTMGMSKTPDVFLLIPMAVLRSSLNNSARERGSEPLWQRRLQSPITASHSDCRSPVDPSILGLEEAMIGGGIDNMPLSPSSSALSTPLPPSSSSSSSSSQSAYIISWIDSKGTFADEFTFQDNFSQFAEYIGRYGRGLVIYWQGLTTGVIELAAQKFGNNLLVTSTFPEEWIFPSRDGSGRGLAEYLRQDV